MKHIYAADFLEVCSALTVTISSGLQYKMWKFLLYYDSLQECHKYFKHLDRVSILAPTLLIDYIKKKKKKLIIEAAADKTKNKRKLCFCFHSNFQKYIMHEDVAD